MLCSCAIASTIFNSAMSKSAPKVTSENFKIPEKPSMQIRKIILAVKFNTKATITKMLCRNCFYSKIYPIKAKKKFGFTVVQVLCVFWTKNLVDSVP